MTTYATTPTGAKTHAFPGDPGEAPPHGTKVICCGAVMNLKPSMSGAWRVSVYDEPPIPPFACRGIEKLEATQ